MFTCSHQGYLKNVYGLTVFKDTALFIVIVKVIDTNDNISTWQRNRMDVEHIS